jgi:hypothetical protein
MIKFATPSRVRGDRLSLRYPVTDRRWDWWTAIWLEPDLDAGRLRFGYCVESTISRIKRRAVGVVSLGERDTGRASTIHEGREETWDVPSIFPPLGHGPTLLRVQKAGQVARPVRMCARSSTNIASSYAFGEVMQTPSRPREEGGTTDQCSALM